ncbi:tripartite tricarboxylate transporter substrate binding protein [Caproiciproducens sp. NJN-50]|uniref:tripartite tricarboxylate transporter substrate binding protein n=1 Tax=Acutalibacteraceae TaxID=3082771 RepID=UPI000FFE2C66|nr:MULTISPECIES: tripartite tricarboxylate transporter substrate binding protein [Acutalibacteraceae]QAT49079.1 tripartite tricarboxylate transporter substrate binding protein [Caproiciproducens sp. NJN-50]
MKKLLSLLLCAGLLLTTAACSNSASSGSSAPSAGSSAAGAASAQKPANFPKKPITFIVPWSAGGTSDGQIRALSSLGQKYFGVACTVVNRDGAGGTIATTEFVNTKADGYTLCLEACGVFTTQPFIKDDIKYSMDDFKPVIGTTVEPIIMVASKSSGIKSLDDLKKKGGTISYGFSGAGSLPQLSQQRFFEMAGLKSSAVPFDGGAPTITALLGAHIDVAAAHPGEIAQYLASGDVVPLGIFSPERDSREALKNIPTFKEQGYDIDMSVWKFLMVPKDTPDDIANYLTDTLAQMEKDPEFTKYCENNTLAISGYKPDEIVTKIKDEAAVNKELLKK